MAVAMDVPQRVGSLADFEEFCSGLVLEDWSRMELFEEERTMLSDYFAGVPESLVLVSKKNGKSSLLGALGLYRLDTDPYSNIAIAASSRDQAMVMFDQMKGFVQRSPELPDDYHVMRGYREIRRGPNSREFTGMVKVYAADADTADGWLGDLAMVDEMHRQKSTDLYGVFRDGLGPRGGQMLTISTAGDHEDSPLGHMRAAAYEMPGFVQDGPYRYARNEALAMHEWAIDSDVFAQMEWPPSEADLEVVKSANPAPWQTIEKLRQRALSPTMTRAQWARFACGVWGLGTNPAFDRERWDSLVSDFEIARGRLVVLGFDGSRRNDATALVMCDVETGHLQLLGIWERPATADDEWEVPEGEVRELVDYAMTNFDVWRFYADPPYWEYTVDWWAGEYGREKVAKVATYNLKITAQWLRAFQNDMVPGRMSHDGSEALSRHIGNSIRRDSRMRDGDEYLWTIAKDSPSSPRKIDAAMAAMLAWSARRFAISEGALNEPASERAVW